MRPLKLLINEKDNLKQKDSWGNPIQYQKCRDIKSGNSFLNIWSWGRYILGKYDIWNSSIGDTLSLEFQDGKMVFEFDGTRYWLKKDSILEAKARDTFFDKNSDVQNIEIEGEFLFATFDTCKIKYKIVENKDKNEPIEFVKISKEDISLEDEIIPDSNCIECENEDCYYCKDRKCTYFDLQLNEYCSEKAFCGEPLIYLEHKKNPNIDSLDYESI